MYPHFILEMRIQRMQNVSVVANEKYIKVVLVTSLISNVHIQGRLILFIMHTST